LKELIKKLTEAYGPPGVEEKVAELISSEIGPYVDEVKRDKLGSVIARRKGDGAKVMLAAHMDEIGLVATYIDKEGFIRFSPVGGVAPYRLSGMRVLFGNGTVGVIGLERVDDPAKAGIDKMFIDIGARSKEEAESKVKVGDFAVFERGFCDVGKRFVAKALDDRIGCVALIETARRLKSSPNDVYFVFTVQEEVGLRGAGPTAYAVDPDIGIAVDVTGTGDTPEAAPMAISLGKGAAIKVKDGSVISHPRVRELLISVAEENSIPYQLEILEWGGTDAGAIHRSKAGIPTGAVSIPTRYIHTPSEMADFDDVEAVVGLLTRFLERDLRGVV